MSVGQSRGATEASSGDAQRQRGDVLLSKAVNGQIVADLLASSMALLLPAFELGEIGRVILRLSCACSPSW